MSTTISENQFQLIIKNAKLVLPDRTVRHGSVAVREGRIAAICADGELDAGSADEVIDARGSYVLPGAIDPHVHIGYKGHLGMPVEELPRQFASESRSAALGGVTSMMITFRGGEDYSGIFDQMRAAGEENSLIDFGYSLGITTMTHVEQIPHYRDALGVSSFKFYMAYRGADGLASGNTYNQFNDGLFLRAVRTISRLEGAMAMVHAENPDIIAMESERLKAEGRDDLATWSESRPDIAEAEAITRAIFIASAAECPLYIPHVSSRAGLEAAQAAQHRGSPPITLETCPHYLTHTAVSPVGNLAKVNPPLRAEADIEALWGALDAGEVQTVGTDHCATSAHDKSGTIWGSVPGFPGLATMVPVILSGVRAGRLSISRAAEVLSENTARAFGLYPAKGSITVGADADLVIVNLDEQRSVAARDMESLSDFSIYEGFELTGWPDVTVSKGRVLVRDGELVETGSLGRYLSR